MDHNLPAVHAQSVAPFKTAGVEDAYEHPLLRVKTPAVDETSLEDLDPRGMLADR
jgi:hypothetical protein